jgi:hypothetical protein
MAQKGRPLDAATIRALQRSRLVASVRQAARDNGVCTRTVQKYTKKKAS